MSKKKRSKKKSFSIKNIKISPKAKNVIHKILEIALVVVLLMIFIFAAAKKLNISAITNLSDNVSSALASMTPGKGYPYQINSSSVKDITVLSGDLLVVLNDRTMVLDSTAKVLKDSQHTYSTPAVSVKGGKAVLYNRNGNRYRIENRSDTLYTGETESEEKIITAALSEKGHLALATTSKSAQSTLTVYSSNYKKIIFQWNCIHDSIISVDLSPNGHYAAVASVGARDGEMYSKVSIFDFEYSDPVSEFEYFGTTILEVHFTKSDNIVAVGDNLTSFIKNFKNKTDLEYGTSTLSNYTFSDDGHTVLALSEHGSSNSDVLSCYSPSFSKTFEKNLDSNVKSLYASNGRISVLLNDKAVIYRTGGSKYKTYKDVDNTVMTVFNMGNKTYAYQMGKITKLK